MKGQTHALLGVVAAVAVHAAAPYLPPAPLSLGLALAAAGVGALLPDIDADESLIRHQTHTARSDGCLGWLVSQLMPSHRGLTHSGLAAASVLLLAWQFRFAWLTALAIGYVSHLLSDMLTRGGVPLAWPIRWRLSLTPMVTGGLGEATVAIAALGWLTVYSLHQLGVWVWIEPYLRQAVTWIKGV